MGTRGSFPSPFSTLPTRTQYLHPVPHAHPIPTHNAATTIAADSAGAVWISAAPSVEGTGGVVLVVAPDQTNGTLAIDSTYAWGNPTTNEIE